MSIYVKVAFFQKVWWKTNRTFWKKATFSDNLISEKKKILRTGSKNLHKGKYDIFLLIYETETASNAKVWTGFLREYT